MFEVALVALLIAGHSVDLPPGAVMRLGDSRFRAGGVVRQLRYTDDGKSLLAQVADAGGAVRGAGWDAATGLPRMSGTEPAWPSLPANAVPAVRLGGTRVLTAGLGPAGLVWDAETRREVARLGGHAAPVTAVAATVDGKRIATASADGLIRIWDGQTFHPVFEPQGHSGRVRAVRFSADGSRAITTGDEGVARVWELGSGRHLRAFRSAGPVGLTADGGRVVTTAGGAVTVRDVATGLEVIPAGGVARPESTTVEAGKAISSTGRITAESRPDGTIELLETATGAVRRSIAGPAGENRVLGFTPDGSRLLTAGADHTVLVWDVRLQAMPLTEAIKKETGAAKLWETMTTGKSSAAYLAMARLAVEPPAAVKMARLRLKPAAWDDEETPALRLADSRAIELLESLNTAAAKSLLTELAAGDLTAWRTREAKAALERVR